MPRFSDRYRARTPSYRRHKASGQAVVTIEGKDFYLGLYGSKISHIEFDRIVGEWLAAGRRLPNDPFDVTIDEVMAAFWQHAEKYYQKRGKPTGELNNFLYALRPLQKLYGHTLACDFGPLSLKAVRHKMLKTGLSRGVINSRVRKIKRMFAWAVAEEMIPVEVHQALLKVEAFKKGRSPARETKRIRPAPYALVEAALAHMAPVPADMVRLQRLTGMRPGEVRIMRSGDIDRSEDVWAYRPDWHKTEHYDKERVIFLGPRAQQILAPYLLRDAESYCFVPSDSERRRSRALRSRRKTRVQPSQQGRRGRTSPPRSYADCYEKQAYNRAIRRACALAAGLKRPRRPADPTEMSRYKADLAEYNSQLKQVLWTPNQLRHTAATELRKQFGLEEARVVLGHSKPNMTETYAEKDMSKAAAIMRQVG
ncbi:MAG: site-specific integrase [Planctomycetes bacterium]|nr:site-specific integrase [Planctomycetota bacterium]